MSNVSASYGLLDDLLTALEFTEGVAWRCAMTGHYFEEVSAHPSDDNFWITVQNSLGESFCLLWCHLFGSRDDDLHYSQFFNRSEVCSLGPKFELANVKLRLAQSIGTEEKVYDELWNEMKRCRDKFIAHREINVTVKFPRTDLYLRIVEELRTILADVIATLHDLNPDNLRIEGLRKFYQEKSNDYVRRWAHLQFLGGLRSGATWAAEITAAHASENLRDINSKATRQ